VRDVPNRLTFTCILSPSQVHLLVLNLMVKRMNLLAVDAPVAQPTEMSLTYTAAPTGSIVLAPIASAVLTFSLRRS